MLVGERSVRRKGNTGRYGCSQYHLAVAGGYVVFTIGSRRFAPTRYREVVLTASKIESRRRGLRPAYRVVYFLLTCVITQIACSSSNNLLLGRVQQTVAGHKIEVTDCYRTSVPPPRQLPDLPGGKKVYEFMPCRDADVLIRGDELIVNGTSYGTLQQGDAITVDHGKVLINEHAALAKAQK